MACHLRHDLILWSYKLHDMIYTSPKEAFQVGKWFAMSNGSDKKNPVKSILFNNKSEEKSLKEWKACDFQIFLERCYKYKMFFISIIKNIPIVTWIARLFV